MANVRKTIAYFKRNGFVNTAYAVTERLSLNKNSSYTFTPVKEEVLSMQKEATSKRPFLFSILVPVYETNPDFLRAMIDSVLSQSYEGFELILADASKTNGPGEVISSYNDERIKYIRLAENKGISANTNEAVEKASGDYCVLCDHDDLLTPDALYEIAASIIKGKANGKTPVLVYTDEDKCDRDATSFFDPNIKWNFNLDMLLSNNYICHITVLKTEYMKELKLREGFDGAQDYDLVLRTVGKLLEEDENPEKFIYHVNKVLYHWRCHEESTALNPQSKDYAYEAGLRALQSFADEHFKGAKASHLLHKGFYRLDYGDEIFSIRKDLGAIGGYVTEGNKITGGAYDENEKLNCLITNRHYSGEAHRGALTRDVKALDIRALTPRNELKELHAKYLSEWQEEIQSLLDEGKNEEKTPKYVDKVSLIHKYNLKFAREASEMGYRLLLDPKYVPFTPKKEESYEQSGELPISVIIPNINGKKYLKECLDSVYAQTKLPMEVIIVDNASTDGSIEFVEKNYKEVKILNHGINTGFTGAANHGINASSGDFVFLLNNDTRLSEDCIEKLYNAIISDDKIFSAGALMLQMDNEEVVDNAGDTINFLGYPRSFANGKSKLDIYVDKAAPVFSACAGAALYRREIFEKIGIFDDMHFAYFEDIDIGYRARIFGYKNVSVRNAIVYHKGSATSGSKHNAFKVSHSSKNSVILFMKNMPFIQYLLFFPFLLAGYIVKLAFFTLKGLGGVYLKGIINGFRLGFSKEGRMHHVKFRFKNLLNYIYIHIWFFTVN